MKKRYKFTRYIVLLLLLSLLFLLPSCKNSFSYNDLEQINYKGLLSGTDYAYIVICWQTDCSNCENLAPTVKSYYEYTKSHKNAYPIYGLNVNLSYNNKIINLEGEYADMIGTTYYGDITAKTTPTILFIVDGTLVKNISDYSTKKPVTEGKAFLNSLMK